MPLATPRNCLLRAAGRSIVVLGALALAAGCGSGSVEAGDEELLDTSTAAAKCKSCSTPTHVTYYVDASGTAATPNGTLKRPFTTIGAALAEATRVSALSVTVRIKDGAYAGDFLIDRPTSFVGTTRTGTFLAGSITSLAIPLVVEHMTIQPQTRGYVAIRAWPVQGADKVYVGSTTSLLDVSIPAASPYGIDQVMGRLSASVLYIDNVQAVDPSSLTVGQAGDGAAIHVAGGTATLSRVAIRNSAQGILAEGAGTVVSAETLTIFDSTGALLPANRPLPAAVNVLGGAHFQARYFEVQRGVGALLKFEGGSTGRLVDGYVETVTVGNAVGYSPGYAVLLGAYGGSDVEVLLTNFYASQLVGLVFDETSRMTVTGNTDPWNPELCAAASPYCGRGYVVADNPVGAMPGNLSYPALCVARHMLYERNGVNIDVAVLPTPPSPVMPGDSVATTTTTADGCVAVPWL